MSRRLTFRFSSADLAQGLADWFKQEARREGDAAAVVRAALRAYRERGGADTSVGPDRAPGLADEDKADIARMVVAALRNAGLVAVADPVAPAAPGIDLTGAREAARSMLGRRPPPDDD